MNQEFGLSRTHHVLGVVLLSNYVDLYADKCEVSGFVLIYRNDNNDGN